MENIEMILESNPRKTKSHVLSNDGFHFYLSQDEFDGKVINEIIAFINGIRSKYKNNQLPIHLDLGEVTISDKLTYVMLESLCYLLIEKYRYKVHLNWRPENKIHTFGVYSSPLLMLKYKDYSKLNEFQSKFKYDTYKNHYRKVVDQSKRNYLGILMSDINTFLTANNISLENREQLSEVVAELVGNAGEHGQSDCLVDIDVTEAFTKNVDGVDQPEDYIGINIAILNFSSKNLNADLKLKIQNNIEDKRYLKLREAYNYHKENFTENYGEEDFWNLGCLQHKISGSLEKISSGGTGSTVLIRSLQEKADANKCYLISGKRALYLIRDYLEFDDKEKMWLGFNKTADFFNDIPEEEVVAPCAINFPGTAYNLTFVMKEEEVK
ncbi:MULTISPECIES: hypothetical protein [Enterococcus]|uniref:hypothetical protein n=1 Tax=Enterococcus TaxID=1350 RepID=UPI000CF2217E|nr:hypothetical protein [Enterococcus faecium]PQC90987.1 hypothetical protein CUN41_04595 [Enterococcus faecium]PQD56027.1 hypothetical protein CUM58_05265 [Enterococcus faecium]ROY02765.1 hypothetical protein EGY02_12020 [Enterococcus faecium]ROY10194.1 hypothetical protein EGW59_12020 [Enterococcus faecium]